MGAEILGKLEATAEMKTKQPRETSATGPELRTEFWISAEANDGDAISPAIEQDVIRAFRLGSRCRRRRARGQLTEAR